MSNVAFPTGVVPILSSIDDERYTYKEIPVRNPEIKVFDPAMCCSTGVCGVDVSQQLVTFAADLEWAKQQGGRIERFNLAQQPMTFVNNTAVKTFLDRSGQDALPLVLVDGEVALAGRYPQRAELARWLGIAPKASATVPAPAPGCCGPRTGCC